MLTIVSCRVRCSERSIQNRVSSCILAHDPETGRWWAPPGAHRFDRLPVPLRPSWWTVAYQSSLRNFFRLQKSGHATDVDLEHGNSTINGAPIQQVSESMSMTLVESSYGLRFWRTRMPSLRPAVSASGTECTRFARHDWSRFALMD